MLSVAFLRRFHGATMWRRFSSYQAEPFRFDRRPDDFSRAPPADVHTFPGELDYSNLPDFGIVASGGDKQQCQKILEDLDGIIEDRIRHMEAQDERFKYLKRKEFVIQKMLGLEAGDKLNLRAKFWKRLHTNKERVPAQVMQLIEKELKTLLQMNASRSMDFQLVYSYLEWLTILPWGKYSDSKFDVLVSQQILDEDHYGLVDVKQRILEFLTGGAHQGKVLCLIGPPGVGKTSICRSIARALNRQFFSFSVGGLCDVSEIKGRQRHWVGAMPGKMVQCLKITGTNNPLVLIDEIDKVDHGLASALLELLDPVQNATFLDHYLDVALDLSKVLFVCTANFIERIPHALLDRMEVISIGGYTNSDKMHIARDYLQRQICDSCGIKPEKVELELTDAALLSIIESYCPEAGVRSLKRHLEKVYKQVVLKLVRQAQMNEVVVDLPNLADYLGKPLVDVKIKYDWTLVGGVMGLNGGSILCVETCVVEQGEGKGYLHITGLVGDIMYESAQIAYTVAKNMLLEEEPTNSFFATSRLHMHVHYEGYTPEDGPSAGCTMLASLLSLSMNKPVKKDMAVMGEVTLAGSILPILKVKEILLMAQRFGVKILVLPKANVEDIDELDPYIKEGIAIHFMGYYHEICDLVFLEHLN